MRTQKNLNENGRRATFLKTNMSLVEIHILLVKKEIWSILSTALKIKQQMHDM